MRWILLALFAALLAAADQPATPAPSPGKVRVGENPSAVAFFESKIRPVLIQHCHECHAGKRRYGGLKVDSLDALLAGGHDEGPAVIPGDTVSSSLLRSIRYEGDSDLNMPPKAKLPDAVIRDFEHWVAIGAPWPDADAATVAAAPPPPRPPFLGRMHPVLVHLPIAALALAAIAELLVLLRGDRWRPATAILVAAGTLGAIAATASGIALESGQDPHLLERHELLGWLTLAGALTASGMLIAMRWVPLRRWPLLAVLILTAALVMLTGHLGGQMVWGEDWLE
jgi:uncharacterized membrane protein/mono/diheme cytochrome c family protein